MKNHLISEVSYEGVCFDMRRNSHFKRYETVFPHFKESVLPVKIRIRQETALSGKN